MGTEFMGLQCWGGTCSLGRARAVSVVGEQAQRAEGRGQDTGNAGAVLPELCSCCSQSKKRTLHSRPNGAKGQ